MLGRWGAESDVWGECYNLGSYSCGFETAMQSLILMCSWERYSAIVLGLIVLISEVGTHDPVLGFVRMADIYVRNV